MVPLVCLGKGGVGMMLWLLLAPLLYCSVRGASTGDCGPIPIVPHAIPLSTDTSLRAIVKYNCTEGYVHTGTRFKNKCRKDGWTNNVVCSPDVGCDNPNKDPAHLNYIYDLPTPRGLKYPVGTVGSVGCTPGFERTAGDRTTTCSSDGTNYWWTHYRTECSPRLCGNPGKPYKGKRDSDIRTMGSQVRFHCDTGYTLVGDSIRTCLADGTWSNHVPTCRLNCCGELQSPSHGGVQHNGDNCYGDTATMTCENGYGISEPGSGTSVTVTCTADGTWSEALPTCTEIPCPEQHLVFGSVEVSGYSYADLIQYRCDELTTTVGDTYGQCLKDGRWNIPPPKCLAHCQERRLDHGTNHYKSNLGHVPHESNQQLSCNSGYRLYPSCSSTSVTCNNGTWTEECKNSTCEPAPCTYRTGSGEDSAIGVDGSTYGEYDEIPSGTTVTIQCAYGYEGGKTVTCSHGIMQKTSCTIKECSLTPSGGTFYTVHRREKWYPYTRYTIEADHVVHGEEVHISCSDGYRRLQEQTQCDAGVFNPALQTCEQLFCSLPPLQYRAPLKMDIKPKYKHQDTLTLQCLKGYRNQTTVTEYKCVNENWTPQAPVNCTDRCIVPSRRNTYLNPPGEYGYSGAKEVASGTNVTVTCAESYKPVHPFSTCQGGFLHPKPEKCKSMHCVIPDLRYGTTVDPPKKRYDHNDQVNINCAPGFALREDAPRVVSCNDTRLPVTFCEEVFCQKPAIRNADFGEERYQHEQIVNVGCKSGYRLKGSTSTTCLDGTWTNLDMQCTDHCIIPSHSYTYFSQSDEVASGTNVTVTCSPSYKPAHPVYTCQAGFLHPTPKGCISMHCVRPHLAQSTTLNPSKDEYTHAERVEINCTAGFALPAGAPRVVICNDTHLPVTLCKQGQISGTTPAPVSDKGSRAADLDDPDLDLADPDTSDDTKQKEPVTTFFTTPTPTPTRPSKEDDKGQRSGTTPSATSDKDKTGDADLDDTEEALEKEAEPSGTRSCNRTNTAEFEFEYGGATTHGAQEKFTCLHKIYAIGKNSPQNDYNYVTCEDGSFVPTPQCSDTIALTSQTQPTTPTTTATPTTPTMPSTPTTQTTVTTRTSSEVTQKITSCLRANTKDYIFDYDGGRTADGRSEHYRCIKTNYIAVGENRMNRAYNYVRCQNGQFEPSPRCKAPPCRVPTNTRFMSFPSTGSINEGDQVQYQCLHGAKARDGTTSGTSTCSEGQWDPKPLCNPRVTNPPATPTQPTIPTTPTTTEGNYKGCSGWLGNNAYFTQRFNRRHGQHGTYRCNLNTRTADGRTRDSTTCSDGEWTPKPQCFHGCSGLLGNNAYFAQKHYRSHGHQVTYNCNPNTRTAEGRTWDRTTCSDGEWDPKPQCFHVTNPPTTPTQPTIPTYPTTTEGNTQSSCRPIEDTHYLDFSTAAVTAHGHWVRYKCLHNSKSTSGQSSGFTKCVNGAWQPYPQCKLASVAGRCFVTSGNNIQYNMPGYRQDGDSVPYTCVSGTSTPVSADQGSTKCKNGELNPQPQCCTGSERTMVKITVNKTCQGQSLGPYWTKWFKYGLEWCINECLRMWSCAGFQWGRNACFFLTRCEHVPQSTLQGYEKRCVYTGNS